MVYIYTMVNKPDDLDAKVETDAWNETAPITPLFS